MMYTILPTLGAHEVPTFFFAPWGHILDRIHSFISVWNGCSLLTSIITGTALGVTIAYNTVNGASFHHSTETAASTLCLLLLSLATK